MMDIFDFISQEELDDLSDDPIYAFADFVRIAQRRLDESNKGLYENDNSHLADANRDDFMTVAIGIARQLDIDTFKDWQVPSGYSRDSGYHQFRAALTHFSAQVAMSRSIANRRESIHIADDSKIRIRTYLEHLRGEIKKSNLTDARKGDLLSRVDELEAALDKSRLSLVAVSRLAFAILAAPGALWASAEVATKLVSNIMQTVGEAKAVDDEKRLVRSPPAPVALPPPKDRAKSAPADLGDEIPF